MKTQIDVPLSIRLKNNLSSNIRIKIMRFLGFILTRNPRFNSSLVLSTGGFKSQCVDIYNRWDLWRKNQDRPRLSQDDISQIKKYYDVQNTDIWKVRTEEKGGMAWNLVDLVEPILARDEVKSVVNIGGQVDRISSHLAGEFPEVNFTSVDFSDDISKWNSSLPQHNNWNFMSGYALDLFEKGVLAADLAMMTSTSVMFTNAELRAYLKSMAPVAKFVVFNEGWWPIHCRIKRPEGLPSKLSVRSGYYANYHHNYVKILEEAGFDVIYSRIVDVPERTYYALQVIGKKKI